MLSSGRTVCARSLSQEWDLACCRWCWFLHCCAVCFPMRLMAQLCLVHCVNPAHHTEPHRMEVSLTPDGSLEELPGSHPVPVRHCVCNKERECRVWVKAQASLQGMCGFPWATGLRALPSVRAHTNHSISELLQSAACKEIRLHHSREVLQPNPPCALGGWNSGTRYPPKVWLRTALIDGL